MNVKLWPLELPRALSTSLTQIIRSPPPTAWPSAPLPQEKARKLPVSAEVPVGSPTRRSGLRIWCCRSCGTRCISSWESTPGPETSPCQGYGRKRKRQKRKKAPQPAETRQSSKPDSGSAQVWSMLALPAGKCGVATAAELRAPSSGGKPKPREGGPRKERKGNTRNTKLEQE